MSMAHKLELLSRVSLPKFIWLNFFSKKVERKGKGFLIPFRHAVIDVRKGGKIILHDGNFSVNSNKPRHSKAEAFIKMGENSVLEIDGNTSLNYKATIEIKPNAKVSIGSGTINSDSVVLAAKSITIGHNIGMARAVFVFDYDHHLILDEDGQQANPPRPVVIGDNVWIGLKSTIIRGSKIGDGAVISTGSLVAGKIKPGTMAVGSPAKSVMEVNWKP